MTQPSHFRCHAFGLLAVAQCQTNRRQPLGLGGVRGGTQLKGSAVRPLSCRDCTQCAAVDAGTEPTLTTLAALEAQVATRPPARQAASLPPDSPMAGVGLHAEPAVRRVASQSKPPPTPALARPYRRWTDEEVELLRREYPAGDVVALCRRLGRSFKEVRTFAWRLGIRRQRSGRGRPGLQREVLAALRRGLTRSAEIAPAIGREPSTVTCALRRLVGKGRAVQTARGEYRPATRSGTPRREGPPSAPPSEKRGGVDGNNLERRVAWLLRDLAARRIGMPDAVRRARSLLKAMGRDVPRDTWETP